MHTKRTDIFTKRMSVLANNKALFLVCPREDNGTEASEEEDKHER